MIANGKKQTVGIRQPARLGSVLRRGSTIASKPTSTRLRLMPMPKVLHEPGKYRTRDEIPEEILATMRAVALGQQPWPLFMWGPAGVGKSCAALALLDYTAAPNHYWTVEGLCEHLIACDKGQVDTGGVHPMTVSRREYWKELNRSELVVLDELGTRTNVTDHHAEVVKRVLDIREGKPLIVISNLRVGEVEGVYADRIASRAAAGTIIDWSHYDDRRLEHHMAKAAD